MIWIKVYAETGIALVPNKMGQETLVRIEETQAALRDSIARARALAEESDRLLRRHRQERLEPPHLFPHA